MTNSEVSAATKGESQVERSFLPGGSLGHFLTGAWSKGNETILFKTTSEEDGLKVIKIEYVLNSGEQFAETAAKLLKQYGAPGLQGPSALGGGACTKGTEKEFSYGWGSVRAEDGTVVADTSGPAVVLRARRGSRAGVISVTITDGPLIRKYFGKEEDKTFQAPSPTNPNETRRNTLLKFGESLKTYAETPSWASEDVTAGSSYKSTWTTTSMREYGRPMEQPFTSHDTLSVRKVPAIHRPAILKAPYPTVAEMEAVIGKSDEHSTGSTSASPVCYKWFASASKSGRAVIEACFLPTGQNRLSRLELYSEGNCDDSITEFIERGPENWERISDTTERSNQ
jgi:hypothetical protein